MKDSDSQVKGIMFFIFISKLHHIRIWHRGFTNLKQTSFSSCFEGAAFVAFFALKNSHLQGLLCLQRLNSIQVAMETLGA